MNEKMTTIQGGTPPLVSVIMGAYNAATTLPKALDSILSQTHPSVELIVCDDASRDDTFALLQAWQANHPTRLKLLRNETNRSLGPTLNRCLEVATGTYVARQDADDFSYPERLARQVAFLEAQNNFDLVATDMMAVSGTGAPLGVRHNSDATPNGRSIHREVPFFHATIMARRPVFETLGGYSSDPHTRRVEDLDLWFRFFEHGFRGHNLPEPLYAVTEDGSQYRRRDFRNYLNTARTNIAGARRLGYPTYAYIYALLPLVKYCVPDTIKHWVHSRELLTGKGPA